MNPIPFPESQSSFTIGEQSRIPTVDAEGRTVHQTFDEMIRANSFAVATDTPTSISGSSIFAESTRNGSIPEPANLPFEAIYSAKPPTPVTFPATTPSGVSGSPAAPGRVSSGLGSSAYTSPLPGFDKESGSL
jgi:hypothetical protein